MNYRTYTNFLRGVIASALAGAVVLHAQSPVLPPAAAPVEEASAMAQYWVLLAQKRYDEAARSVTQVLSRYPRNIAALSIVIETTIAQSGAAKALDTYEAWLGRRTFEEPGVLRRVARAYLYEWGRQERDAAVRSEALLALARDGDDAARAALGSAGADAAARAKLGDRAAVDRLAEQMNAATGVKIREIRRLAETAHPRAAEALVAVLRDQWPENRAAAAEALGRFGRPQDADALRPLLKDPHGVVRIAAAGALLRLADGSGVNLLQDLAASENASQRLTAARLLAAQPDENWKALVRGLTSDPDASIRVDAARLIAPYDPQLARSVLDALARDPNLAIREEANLALVETAASDLAALRRVLRSGNSMAKVRAADRVLALTR